MFHLPWLVATALAATLTAGTASTTGTATGASTDRHRYGQAQFQQDLDAIRDLGVPGVLAEVDSGRTHLRGGSGVADLDTGAPAAPNGHFRMGSNTKTFVAVVVLQLVAERRLALTDPVERWLPGLVTGNGNDGRAITVRDLLQHTSGLANYTDDLSARIDSPESYREFEFASFTPRALVDLALAHPPLFAPGQGWSYANTNYVLLGMIIKQVTGRDWATEVDRRILHPLGLRQTSAPGERTDLPVPHSSAYLFLSRDLRLETSAANLSWADAAGALVTDAADLSRFWSAIGRGTLLRPAEQAAMRHTVAADSPDQRPGVRYGLGLQWEPLSCGGGYWGHDGDVPGFSTVAGVSADGRTTVVVSMSASVDDNQIAHDLLDHAMCGLGR